MKQMIYPTRHKKKPVFDHKNKKILLRDNQKQEQIPERFYERQPLEHTFNSLPACQQQDEAK